MTRSEAETIMHRSFEPADAARMEEFALEDGKSVPKRPIAPLFSDPRRARLDGPFKEYLKKGVVDKDGDAELGVRLSLGFHENRRSRVAVDPLRPAEADRVGVRTRRRMILFDLYDKSQTDAYSYPSGEEIYWERTTTSGFPAIIMGIPGIFGGSSRQVRPIAFEGTPGQIPDQYRVMKWWWGPLGLFGGGRVNNKVYMQLFWVGIPIGEAD